MNEEDKLLGESVKELRQLDLNKLERELCDPNDKLGLTPLRSHYLKKYLISKQIQNEIDLLNEPNSLSYFGPPFKSYIDNDNNDELIDIPFLKFIFNNFIINFPFLRSAPDNFWSDKVQVFVKEFLERNLASTGDEEELTKRHAIRLKLEKHLTILLSSCFKVVGGEAVVKVDQSDLQSNNDDKHKNTNAVKMQVNIVTIRNPQRKSRVHQKPHEEFIICSNLTRYDGYSQDIYVARRYNDFKTLATNLRNEFPDEELPTLPHKDKSSSALQQDSSPASSNVTLNETYNTGTVSLSRDKNRLTLRAYLRSLLTVSKSVASSQTLQTFLLSNPTTISQDEIEDAKIRSFNDSIRDAGKEKFKLEMDARANEVMESVKMFKADISSKDGLKNMFSIIKNNPTIDSLPPRYLKVFEWARISCASTIYQTFVASDTSSETFNSLKRIHGLMPYFVLRGILKISNPIAMVRGVIDLFLAQPFGQRSILQRMFSASIYEDIKQLESDIAIVRERINNDTVSDKLLQFVNAPKEIQELYKNDAAEDETHLVNVILRSGDVPTLSGVELQQIAKGYEIYASHEQHKVRTGNIYVDEGPSREEGWLFIDLINLLKLYTKLRDKEQLIEMIFEGVTADLLKDIVTIFYTPLAQVYKAANIVDSIYDLQMFITDLIKTVEEVEERSHIDPAGTVHTFVDLVKRHEGQFYAFVHKVHSKGEELFDSFGSWIERFFDYLRDGISNEIDLEFILPHRGEEREMICKEIDALAIYHYKMKLAHEQRMREKYMQSQENEETTNETSEWVAGLVGQLGVDEVMTAEVNEVTENDDQSTNDDESIKIGDQSITETPEISAINDLLPIFVELVKQNF